MLDFNDAHRQGKAQVRRLLPDVDRPPVDFALYMASHGFRILPIPPRKKAPILKDWPNKATTDPGQIVQWFDQQPEGNYGILTNGLIAVDVDPKHGGHLWLEENEEKLPDTLRLRTGSGGWHILFKAPEGRNIGNRAGIAPGIDIRGRGGQIVGPGSIHPNGKQYTIEVGPDDVDLAVAPQWLVDLIAQPASNGQTGMDFNTAPKHGVDIEACQASIRAGRNWHDNMVRLVGHWVARGWSDEEVLAAAEALTLPGYTVEQTRREVSRMIEGARAKGYAPSGATASTGDAPENTQEPLSDPFARLPAPPLAHGILPPIIEAFADAEAREKGTVFHGPAMAALTVCAAAIPDHVRIRVKVHKAWIESARLWTTLIGPPSAKKSPILRAAMAPLKRVEKQNYAKRAEAMKEWEQQDKEGRGPEPTVHRHVLNDSTVEAAAKILAENNHGLLLERDELAGWFGSLDKYNGGKGAAADRGFWLQAWNGGPYSVDRISRGRTLYVSNLSVSILGGIQPDAIRHVTADAVDDGLIQRLIPVSLGPAKVGEDLPGDTKALANYDALVQRLTKLPEIGGAPTNDPFNFNTAGDQRHVIFDANAQESRRNFEIYANDLTRLEAISPQFAAFAGKLDGMFARLALTFHCCENIDLRLTHDATSIPNRITKDTAERVTRLMREFVIPHALHFYLEVTSETTTLANARTIAGYILAKRVDRLTYGILSRDCRPCRNSGREEVIRMIEPLEMFGWLQREGPGPVPRAWKVNPRVHAAFATRAEAERRQRAKTSELLQQLTGST